MKKIMFIIPLSIFILTGCWDKHEIEEQAFVVVIGLDDSEKEDGVSVTYQIANPQVGIPNTGGEKEVASEIITFTAPDFITARDLANATVARKVNFAHTKAMVIGEDFIRTEKAKKFLTSGIRDREIRRDIQVVVSKEKAADFIKNNNPNLETRPHKFYDLMTGRWAETGLVPLSDLQRYFQRIESKNDAYLAIYATTEKSDDDKYGNEDDYLPGQIDQKGSSRTQLIGSALLKDGVMIGTLTGEETRSALNLRSKSIAKYMRVTYKDPFNKKYRVAALLTKPRSNKIEILTQEVTPKVNVTIPLSFKILAIPSGENYVTNLENQELLRRHVEDTLKKKYNELVKITQEEYKINPFNWSRVARKNFLTMQEYEEYDWDDKYTNADVNIKVEVKFTGFGKQLGPPKVDEKDEGK
ncbi:Ger(x)C family spore germination protein [Bacillus piscicola]|uniref:Ger(x)C family spore germination protein n=1 Tax=Bacillus piscicola TaxID=1632684 RepID=UPI001F09CCE3|nr:Ger(x)C family spore germination protein [Bacillus piscicola]